MGFKPKLLSIIISTTKLILLHYSALHGGHCSLYNACLAGGGDIVLYVFCGGHSVLLQCNVMIAKQ